MSTKQEPVNGSIYIEPQTGPSQLEYPIKKYEQINMIMKPHTPSLDFSNPKPNLDLTFKELVLNFNHSRTMSSVWKLIKIDPIPPPTPAPDYADLSLIHI